MNLIQRVQKEVIKHIPFATEKMCICLEYIQDFEDCTEKELENMIISTFGIENRERYSNAPFFEGKELTDMDIDFLLNVLELDNLKQVEL